MPLDLAELLAPEDTAVLTMEVQRGVLGDLSMIPDLVDEVHAEGVLEHIGAVCRAARAAEARVVHCTRSSAPTTPVPARTRRCCAPARAA